MVPEEALRRNPVKSERRRFSRSKKRIRESVRDEMIDRVQERIEDFLQYLKGWCGDRQG